MSLDNVTGIKIPVTPKSSINRIAERARDRARQRVIERSRAASREGTPDRWSLDVPAPPVESLLDLEFKWQRQTFWCWAACCEMFLNYVRIPADQESIVSRRFGRNCSIDPGTRRSPCDTKSWPSQAFEPWGYYCEYTPYPQDGGRIEAEILAKWPVIVGLRKSRSKHLILITGYYADNTYRIADPMSRNFEKCDYSRLVNYFQSNSWIATFNIRKQRQRG